MDEQLRIAMEGYKRYHTDPEFHALVDRSVSISVSRRFSDEKTYKRKWNIGVSAASIALILAEEIREKENKQAYTEMDGDDHSILG